MSCCSDQASICPCGAFVNPAVISNVAGLDAIAYRVGDYTTFREALLRGLPGEVSLTYTPPASNNVVQIWRPGATGDLAVQMIEWWAYLADILMFYNERTATQAYIRTADQSITVNRLVRLLGYRPKPGIGATGTLAALTNVPTAFTLPQGFQIQSKPGPGQQPQIFELKAATTVGPLAAGPSATGGVSAGAPAAAGPTTGTQGAVTAILKPDSTTSYVTGANDHTVTLQGTVSAIKPGDQILIVPANGVPSQMPPASWVFATATSITNAKDPQLGAITSIQFTTIPNAPTQPPSPIEGMASPQLLKTNQSVQVWQYPADPGYVVRPANQSAPTPTQVDLQTIVRVIKINNYIVFENALATPTAQLGVVTGSSEAIWYSNPLNYSATTTTTLVVNPAAPPPEPVPGATGNVPVPILHTSIAFNTQPPLSVTDTQANRPAFLVWYGWQNVGPLVKIPAPALVASASAGSPVALAAPAGASLPSVTVNTQVQVQDSVGNGASGTLDSSSNLTLAAPIPTLFPPLSVLFNLLPVTRGKTAANEVLGSGNAAVANQDFVLLNSPVTYLQDSAGLSGSGFSSTVQLWVNNAKWTEVQNFYGQLAHAQVFITKEDEQGRTHAILGDGVNGARPATGVNNIVATYRYGSGAAAPAAGALTMILKPWPGLQSIQNPVQVGGGGDPDPPDRVRQYAPQSVLTFGRAISLDDFEAVAGAASGVTRAQAVLGLNPISQRPRVQVFVLPGTTGAVNSAQQALAGAADPNRIPAVQPANMVSVSITATLLVATNANPATVQANATSALAGQGGGLFVFDPNSGSPGVYVLGIGQPVFDSQIYAALKVAGVRGVEGYTFSYSIAPYTSWTPCSRQRHDPKSGNYFALAWSNLTINVLPPIPPS